MIIINITVEIFAGKNGSTTDQNIFEHNWAQMN